MYNRNENAYFNNEETLLDFVKETWQCFFRQTVNFQILCFFHKSSYPITFELAPNDFMRNISRNCNI